MGLAPFGTDRRRYLIAAGSASALGILGLLTWRKAAVAKTPTNLRGGHYRLPQGYSRNVYYSATAMPEKQVFDWNFETGLIRNFECGVATHVVETHPHDFNLSALGTKKMDRIAMVDWSKQTEISHFQFPAGEFFYGHVAFSDSGEFLIASSHAPPVSNRLCIFEVPSLKLVDSVELSFGTSHDIVAIGNDKFVLSISSTKKPRAGFGRFDFRTKKVDYFGADFMYQDVELVAAHLKDCGDRFVANVQLTANGDLATGSLVSLDKNTNEVISEIPSGLLKLNSEMLSLEHDPTTDYVWISLPHQNEVVVWDLKQKHHLKTLEFHKGTFPTGISCLPGLDVMLVTCASRFFAFHPRTLARLEKFEERAPHQVLNRALMAHSRIV